MIGKLMTFARKLPSYHCLPQLDVTLQIERSGMDGSHRQVLVDTHLKWPNGITLDYEEKRLYWADAKLNTIASCRFDGSQRRVVLSSRETVDRSAA